MIDKQKTWLEIKYEYLTKLHEINQERIKQGLPILPIDGGWGDFPKIKSDILDKDKPSVKGTEKTIRELNLFPLGYDYF